MATINLEVKRCFDRLMSPTGQHREVKPMRFTIGRISRAFVGVLVGTVVGFLLVVRFKPRPLLRGIRAFNKRLLNPAMLRLAGTRFWYASSLQHTGRRTGQHFVVPVVAEPTDGGFVIPLPYGSDVDWLKNVLASGTCSIRHRGEEHDCGEPVVLGLDQAATLVPARRRRAWRFMGIDQVVAVEKAPVNPRKGLPTQ